MFITNASNRKWFQVLFVFHSLALDTVSWNCDFSFQENMILGLVCLSVYTMQGRRPVIYFLSTILSTCFKCWQNPKVISAFHPDSPYNTPQPSSNNSGLFLADTGGHLKCWGSNPGWSHARQASYQLYLSLLPATFMLWCLSILFISLQAFPSLPSASWNSFLLSTWIHTQRSA